MNSLRWVEWKKWLIVFPLFWTCNLSLCDVIKALGIKIKPILLQSRCNCGFLRKVEGAKFLGHVTHQCNCKTIHCYHQKKIRKQSEIKGVSRPQTDMRFGFGNCQKLWATGDIMCPPRLSGHFVSSMWHHYSKVGGVFKASSVAFVFGRRQTSMFYSVDMIL